MTGKSMNQLKGESLLLVKVKPGEVHKAVRDLRRNEEITEVNAVLGPYDIVASGSFEDHRSLRNFAELVESKPFCQSCNARPALEFWERETENPSQGLGWTLIKSSNPSGTLKELRKLENIRKLIWTAGEYNIIANFSVGSQHEWNSTVFKRIQSATGIRDTLTLPSLPD
ncbi:MAG: Lrp/AsnC ligand binding domain-containing protein [Thermoplasmata archaeon]